MLIDEQPCMLTDSRTFDLRTKRDLPSIFVSLFNSSETKTDCWANNCFKPLSVTLVHASKETDERLWHFWPILFNTTSVMWLHLWKSIFLKLFTNRCRWTYGRYPFVRQSWSAMRLRTSSFSTDGRQPDGFDHLWRLFATTCRQRSCNSFTILLLNFCRTNVIYNIRLWSSSNTNCTTALF